MTIPTTCPVRLEDAPVSRSRTEAWEYLRSGGDVFEVDGVWHLTSAEAVRFALRSPLIFSNAIAAATSGAEGVCPDIPNGVDPPEHTRYRRVINPLFAPRMIRRMEQELRRQANLLIDAFIDSGRCEVMADIANLFPAQVFLTMFGLPLEDREKIVAWVLAHYSSDNKDQLIAFFHGKMEPPAELPPEQNPAIQLAAYLREKIAEKRINPGDDVISKVMAAASSGEKPWTDDELTGFAFLVTQAGLDTVTNSIGFLFHHLARNPELRRRLLREPNLVGPAIEEILRIETVAPLMARITTQDVEVCGKTIPAHSLVWICYGAANRDPDMFELPEEMNLSESRAEHFAFGDGIHICLGAHLARQELRIIFEEFHRRIPDYELEAGAEPTVHWPAFMVSLDKVPLTFPPGRAADTLLDA